MKTGYYRRLAWTNLRKNKRLYVPNILTGMGLAAVFYIVLTLAMDERLQEVRGGSYLRDIMPLGVAVMGLLSFVLVLYTNSFLMKQRSREFGLYNVLGLEKRHIGRILFWETAFCALFVLAGGLIAGMVLYKLCALLICRVLAVESVLGFYHISAGTLLPSAVFFPALYFLTYLLNRVRIARLKPVEMLQSAHTGEREPRVKWPLLLVGVVTLGAGYAIAIVTKEPLMAIYIFFVAVILVVIGTYCLFTAGSIALLKFLKRRPGFYYQKKHMVAVSGLLYRMKQNAVGLASITVLATMVLVTVSATVSLYAGIEDTKERQSPHQVVLSAEYGENGETAAIPEDVLLDMVNTAAEENDLTVSFAEHQRYLSCAFLRDDDVFWTDRSRMSGTLMECFFITAEEYETQTGVPLDLADDQMAVYGAPGNVSGMLPSFTLGDRTFDCTVQLDGYPIAMEKFSSVDRFGFVVKDEATFQYICELQKAAYGVNASEIENELVIDFSDEKAAGEHCGDFGRSMRDQLIAYAGAQLGTDAPEFTMSISSVWDIAENLYGLYGTLLFLGLLLSVVFLFATALIIYYKQISEGYEDRERFQIMQKVGMSADEVQGAIRSQIVMVFFLPLLAAAMHVAFAFPLLTRVLCVLFMSDRALFMGCTIAALGVFALIYVLIYSITARVYYRIVK